MRTASKRKAPTASAVDGLRHGPRAVHELDRRAREHRAGLILNDAVDVADCQARGQSAPDPPNESRLGQATMTPTIASSESAPTHDRSMNGCHGAFISRLCSLTPLAVRRCESCWSKTNRARRTCWPRDCASRRTPSISAADGEAAHLPGRHHRLRRRDPRRDAAASATASRCAARFASPAARCRF